MIDPLKGIRDIFDEHANDKCYQCGIEMRLHTPEQMDDCWNAIKGIEQDQLLIDDAIRTMSVSPNFGTQRFSDLNPDIERLNIKSWSSVEEFKASANTGLYLYGPPGTGKTHAARCVLYQAMRARETFAETNAYKLLRMSKRFDAEATVARYERVKYLLIDDIDKADWFSSDLSFLWHLLNSWVEYGGRTIITANVAPKDFRKVFGEAGEGNSSKIEATLQRLHPVKVVDFTGKSVRGMV